MKKIIAGLVVVVAAVGVIKVVSKEESPISQEVIEVDATDSADVSDNLYQDTFSDTDSKEEIEKADKEDEEEKLKEEQKQELDKLVESELKEYEEEQEKEANSTKSASGQFEGFADSNFIEVKVGNTYDVFKVTDAVKSKLQSKSVGQSISFTYVSSAGQKVITSIN